MTARVWTNSGPFIKEADDERHATIATVHTGVAADAELMSAAPELLEALLGLLDWQNEIKHPVPLYLLTNARRAVRKAVREQ